jgi:hypothetical protein
MTVAKGDFRILSDTEELETVSAPPGPLVLTGPPEEMTGRLTLRNGSQEPLFLRGLDLLPGRAKKAAPALGALSFRARLLPGEEKATVVTTSLDPSTPPGSYRAKVRVGSRQHDVELIVQPRVAVRVTPRELHFVGVGPGRGHEAQVLLVNEGNVPVQVPPLAASTALDIDAICRNLSLAVRQQGAEGVTPTLDAFFQGLRKEMAGWVRVSIQQGKEIVGAGASLLLQLVLKLPRDVNPEYQYRGSVRLLGQQIFYTFTPEPTVLPAKKTVRKKTARKKTAKKTAARKTIKKAPAKKGRKGR